MNRKIEKENKVFLGLDKEQEARQSFALFFETVVEQYIKVIKVEYDEREKSGVRG